MTEPEPKKEFDFKKVVDSTPGLRGFVTEVQDEMEQMEQEYSEQELSRLFSKMDCFLKRSSWVSWLNRDVPVLNGRRPRDLILTREVEEIESLIDNFSYEPR